MIRRWECVGEKHLGSRTADCKRTHRAHRPCREWCRFCGVGRCVNSLHMKSYVQDDLEGVLHESMDCGCLGEKESEEQLTRVLVIHERRHKMTWALLVPRNGTEFPWIAKRAAKFIDQLGHNRVTLGCDNEPATEALAGYRTSSSRRKSDCARETTSWRESVQRNHRTHGGTGGWPGPNTESCIGAWYWPQGPT